MTATEQWRPSPIGGDHFEVSDQGHVRRKFVNGTYRLKHPYLDGTGYLRAGIGSHGPVHIHRLVALAFLDQTGPVVRHLDGNPLNNTVSNLAWGSHADNMQDRVRHGRHPNANKTHCAQGHPFDDANTYIARESANGTARVCRTCNRLHAAAARRKAKETNR